MNILGGYSGYNADMFRLDDDFDVEFTLPPLPPRVYEVRVGLFQNAWSTPMGSEEAVQVYIDGKVEGDTYNINFQDPQPGVQTGYVYDERTYDNGMENDKHMRYLGWMKAPNCFYWGEDIPARDVPYFMRKIITRKYFDSGKHTIRFRYVGPDKMYISMDVDYLEFVPLHIMSDPTKPEDRY